MFYYLFDWYHHQFLIDQKINFKISITSSWKSFFLSFVNYFIPEGRIDVFAVGARSPVCFGGFVGIPAVAGGGTFPVVAVGGLIDWLEADRAKFVCESPTTDSICAALTYRPWLSLHEKYRKVVPSK
jgi:hypothetical protein